MAERCPDKTEALGPIPSARTNWKFMMHKIEKILAREILDSRGNPTVEVDLYLSNGSWGRAAVPSGASTGSYEACELRDEDEARYGGKGVLKAVERVNISIYQSLVGKEFEQASLDEAMIKLDGTPNKSRLGANAILGASLAFAKAAADAEGVPLYEYFKNISDTPEMILPAPMMNILNGGRHALGSTDLQEFMIQPLGAPSFKEALRYGAEIFHTLGKILKENNLNTSVGDEGGYAPALSSNEEAVEIILEAVKKAGYEPGKDVFLALDIAASEIYDPSADGGKYNLATEGKKLSSEEMISFCENWVEKYPIISIEDPLSEDDWEGFKLITEKIGDRVQIVGDDLFVTNTERLEKGIGMKACNSILIKLNQVGTVTETIKTFEMAKRAGYKTIISHRSGETEDSAIADFAVGLGAGQIKTGSLCRGERTAKYNQLLRIEEELGEKAKYARKF